MREKRFIWICIFVFLGFLSCHRESDTADLPVEYREFATFYERFHSDSTYQMAHIVFPLQGLPAEVDSATLAAGDFVWTAENWEIHRPFAVDNPDFKRDFMPVGKDLIIERIVHKTGQYGMIRRWARMGEEWHLIYYAAMNQFQ